MCSCKDKPKTKVWKNPNIYLSENKPIVQDFKLEALDAMERSDDASHSQVTIAHSGGTTKNYMICERQVILPPSQKGYTIASCNELTKTCSQGTQVSLSMYPSQGLDPSSQEAKTLQTLFENGQRKLTLAKELKQKACNLSQNYLETTQYSSSVQMLLNKVKILCQLPACDIVASYYEYVQEFNDLLNLKEGEALLNDSNEMVSVSPEVEMATIFAALIGTTVAIAAAGGLAAYLVNKRKKQREQDELLKKQSEKSSTLKALKDQEADLDDALDQRTQELEAAKVNQARLQQELDEVNRAKQDLQSKGSDTSDLEAKRLALEQKLELSNQKVGDLEAELTVLKDTNSKQKNIIDKLRKTNTSLTWQSVNNKSKIKALQAELARAKASSDSSIGDLQTKLRVLETRQKGFDQLQSAHTALLEQFKTQEALFSKQRKLLKSQAEQLKQKQTRIDELEGSQTTLSQEEQSELMKLRNEATTDKASLQKAESKLQIANKALNQSRAKVEQKDLEIVALKNKAQALELRNLELITENQRLQAIQTKSGQLSKAQKQQLLTAQRDLQSAQAEQQRLIGEHQEAMERQQAQTSRLEGENQNLRKELAAITKTAEDLDTQLLDLEAHHQANVALKQKQLDAVTQQKADLQASNTRLQADLDASKLEVERLKASSLTDTDATRALTNISSFLTGPEQVKLTTSLKRWKNPEVEATNPEGKLIEKRMIYLYSALLGKDPGADVKNAVGRDFQKFVHTDLTSKVKGKTLTVDQAQAKARNLVGFLDNIEAQTIVSRPSGMQRVVGIETLTDNLDRLSNLEIKQPSVDFSARGLQDAVTKSSVAKAFRLTAETDEKTMNAIKDFLSDIKVNFLEAMILMEVGRIED